jgi:hypothetical protein
MKSKLKTKMRTKKIGGAVGNNNTKNNTKNNRKNNIEKSVLVSSSKKKLNGQNHKNRLIIPGINGTSSNTNMRFNKKLNTIQAAITASNTNQNNVKGAVLMPPMQEQYTKSLELNSDTNRTNFVKGTIGGQLLQLLHKRLSKYIPTINDAFWDKYNINITPTEEEKILINHKNKPNNNINFRINLYTQFINTINTSRVKLIQRVYTYPLETVSENGAIEIAPMVVPFLESLHQETIDKPYTNSKIQSENINLLLSASHGNIKSGTLEKLPDNVILIYITPINRYGMYEREYIKKINDLMLSFSKWINNNPAANVFDILKMIKSFVCFLEAAVFFPGQEYLNVHLDFEDETAESGFRSSSAIPFGFYKYSNDVRKDTDMNDDKLHISDMIDKHIGVNDNKLNIYLVHCCRMCDTDITPYFTERIYIYEAFYDVLNSFIIDELSNISDFNISRDGDCIYQIEQKKPANFPGQFRNNKSILNLSLSPTKTLMNELTKLFNKKFTPDQIDMRKTEMKRILKSLTNNEFLNTIDRLSDSQIMFLLEILFNDKSFDEFILLLKFMLKILENNKSKLSEIKFKFLFKCVFQYTNYKGLNAFDVLLDFTLQQNNISDDFIIYEIIYFIDNIYIHTSDIYKEDLDKPNFDDTLLKKFLSIILNKLKNTGKLQEFPVNILESLALIEDKNVQMSKNLIDCLRMIEEMSENKIQLSDELIYKFFINLYLQHTYNNTDNTLLQFSTSYLNKKHPDLTNKIIKKISKKNKTTFIQSFKKLFSQRH